MELIKLPSVKDWTFKDLSRDALEFLCSTDAEDEIKSFLTVLSKPNYLPRHFRTPMAIALTVLLGVSRSTSHGLDAKDVLSCVEMLNENTATRLNFEKEERERIAKWINLFSISVKPTAASFLRELPAIEPDPLSAAIALIVDSVEELDEELVQAGAVMFYFQREEKVFHVHVKGPEDSFKNKILVFLRRQCPANAEDVYAKFFVVEANVTMSFSNEEDGLTVQWNSV